MKYTQSRRGAQTSTAQVTGPDGNILTPANLPPGNLSRWSARRKAEVIAAINGGLLTIPEACHRYRLTMEEFLEWERHYKAAGVDGLRASAKHMHREPGTVH